VKLKNVDIEGLSSKGLHVGRLTDWSLENVKINGNGTVGWDGDVGANHSSNSGTILFKNVEIAWNGCTFNYPNRDKVGCWAQDSGGYGDGLGTHATGGLWIFEDSHIHHNTSDGIDLLYATEDIEVVFRRVLAEGNAGNQLKASGKTLLEDSLIIGNCGYFSRHSSGLVGGENCRATGNVLSLGLKNDKQVMVRNNSIFSEGDAAILSVCDSGCDYSKIKFDLYNNIVVGYADYHQSSFDISAFHWHENTANSNDGMAIGIGQTSRNILFNVKHNFCPPGDNLCQTNPGLVSISNIDQINPVPLSISRAIDAANPTKATGTDLNKRPRNPADIGALEH
jgi:hypothetical protein